MGMTLDLENPSACAATGRVTDYSIVELAVDPDPVSGFDLDNTEGSSCIEGERTSSDPPGGVDNSLALVEAPFPGDTSLLNAHLFNRVCYGAATVSLQVDANAEEACATVTVVSSGEVVASGALHLSGGCLYGTLDRFPFPITDEDTPVGNARLTATLHATGLSNMVLGATADSFTGRRIFDILGNENSWVSYTDVRSDRDGTGLLQCDAVSLTLLLAGVVQ
jgi:hypothetical protein